MFLAPSIRRTAIALGFAALAGACHGSDASTPVAPSAAAGATPAIAAPRIFKVATWNIRSGMGIRGFTTTSWSHETINCTDRSKPINAWGIGLPQAELGRIKDDPSIVALALQEAWNCGSPNNVNGVVGFKTASGERDGTALLARYGFSGPVKYQDIDPKAHQWVVGGDVCLDAACSATMPIFSGHFGSVPDDEIPNQAQRTIDFLAGQGTARVFMGDLNVYQSDAWNPKVPCTGEDNPGRMRTISLIESAGYTDAWKATQSSEGWTGMASRPGCGSPLGNLFKRIDYVYSTGLRTLSTDRFARAAPGADSPSDHVGLIAELSTAK
ncbi:MAG: endonuclease/exonuclease/phosphatase family protein [Acidobacteriota bacterium]